MLPPGFFAGFFVLWARAAAPRRAVRPEPGPPAQSPPRNVRRVRRIALPRRAAGSSVRRILSARRGDSPPCLSRRLRWPHRSDNSRDLIGIGHRQ